MYVSVDTLGVVVGSGINDKAIIGVDVSKDVSGRIVRNGRW